MGRAIEFIKRVPRLIEIDERQRWAESAEAMDALSAYHDADIDDQSDGEPLSWTLVIVYLITMIVSLLAVAASILWMSTAS